MSKRRVFPTPSRDGTKYLSQVLMDPSSEGSFDSTMSPVKIVQDIDKRLLLLCRLSTN